MLLGCLGINSQASAVPVLNTVTLDDIAPTAGSSATKLPDGVLQLTDNTKPDASYQIGSAYSTSPVGIESFHATFSFQFSGTAPGRGSADGIVFVIKNPDSPTSGGDGGGLGYGTITTDSGSYSGIPKSVGIEFDNWNNSEVNDPSGNHIGIDINGSVVSVATLDISPDFNGRGRWNAWGDVNGRGRWNAWGDVNGRRSWNAWIDYDGSVLSVSVSQTDVQPESPMLSYTIGNIQSLIDSPDATIGFTGATGWATQTQQVSSLYYSDPPLPEPGAVALLGVGGVLVRGWTKKRRRGNTC